MSSSIACLTAFNLFLHNRDEIDRIFCQRRDCRQMSSLILDAMRRRPLTSNRTMETQVNILKRQQAHLHHQLLEQELANLKLYQLLLEASTHRTTTATTTEINQSDLNALLADLAQPKTYSSSLVNFMSQLFVHRLVEMSSNAGGVFVLIAASIVFLLIGFLVYCLCCYCWCCCSTSALCWLKKLISMCCCSRLKAQSRQTRTRSLKIHEDK